VIPDSNLAVKFTGNLRQPLKAPTYVYPFSYLWIFLWVKVNWSLLVGVAWNSIFT